MGFESLLQETIRDLEGIRGISLVGLDGIAISSIVVKGKPDLDGMSAELTTFLKTLRSSSSSLNGNTIEQMVIYTSTAATIMHEVTRDYFVVVMTDRDSLLGKARYRLIRLAGALMEEMA